MPHSILLFVGEHISEHRALMKGKHERWKVQRTRMTSASRGVVVGGGGVVCTDMGFVWTESHQSDFLD